VIPNNKLLAVISEQTPVQEAFGLPMTFCVKVQGISDIITIPGLVNVDFADVRAVMADAGSALMGIELALAKRGQRSERSYLLASTGVLLKEPEALSLTLPGQ